MYVHNGKGVHFYLAVGQLTPLLQWMGPDNLTMELHGTTFQNPKTGNQWFRRLVVTQNTSTVLADVSTDHTRFGEQQTVDEGGLTLSIHQSAATKFAENDERQLEDGHLNLKFEGAIPDDATGLFAELAGVQPMSVATKSLLQPTSIAKGGRPQRKGGSKGGSNLRRKPKNSHGSSLLPTDLAA